MHFPRSSPAAASCSDGAAATASQLSAPPSVGVQLAGSSCSGQLLPVQLQRSFGGPLPEEQRQPSCSSSVFSVQLSEDVDPKTKRSGFHLAPKLQWPRSWLAKGSAGRAESGGSSGLWKREVAEGGRESRVESRSCTAAFAFSVTAAALLAAASGYSICVTAVALQSLQRQFRLCGGTFACMEKGLFIAVMSPGAALGSLVGGGVSDFFGRVFCLRVFALLLGISTAVTVAAPSYSVVLLARAAAGVFVCVLLVAVCAYLAEISTASSRGKFIAAVEICQAAGCSLPYVLGAVVPELDWRHFIAFSAALILPALLLLPFLVESPVYLLAIGKTEAAVSAMTNLGFTSEERRRLLENAPRLRRASADAGLETESDSASLALQSVAGSPKPCNERAAKSSVGELAETGETDIPGQNSSEATTREVCREEVEEVGTRNDAEKKKDFASKASRLWWSMLLPAGLGVLHNLLFVNSFLLMAPDIILLIGRCDASAAVACIGAAKMIGAIMSLAVVDRIGRRSLLVFGAGAVSCGLFFLSCIHLLRDFALSPAVLHPCFRKAFLESASQVEGLVVNEISTAPPSNFEIQLARRTTDASLALLFLLLLSWGGTWAVGLPLVAAETSPRRHRALGVGVAKACSWAVSALVQLSLEPLFVYFGLSASFLVFSSLALAPMAFAAAYVRDTAGGELDIVKR